MYHCHILHHEDDGMMGSFVVIDTTATGVFNLEKNSFIVYPNPASNLLFIQLQNTTPFSEVFIQNVIGKIVLKQTIINSKVS
jgi:hypothetical protein